MRQLLGVCVLVVFASCADSPEGGGTQQQITAVNRDAGIPVDAPIHGALAANPSIPHMLSPPSGFPIDETPESALNGLRSRAVGMAVIEVVNAESHATAEYPHVSTTWNFKLVRHIDGQVPLVISMPGGSIPGRTIKASEQADLRVGQMYLVYIWPTNGQPEVVAAFPMIDDQTFRIHNTSRSINVAVGR